MLLILETSSPIVHCWFPNLAGTRHRERVREKEVARETAENKC